MLDSIDSAREMFRYDHWANRRVLEALRSAPEAQSALRTFAHILAAERTWLDRMLRGLDATTGSDFWPSLTLAECESLLKGIEEQYRTFLSELDADGLRRVAEYRNSRGELYHTSFTDVLQHVVSHSAYHRGQVASAVRASGSTPPLVDYIVYVRERDREDVQ